MTNSRDFRRYSYSADTAYALKAFSRERVVGNVATAAAPQYIPEPVEEEKEVEKSPRTKSVGVLRREQRVSALKAGIIVVITAVFLCAFGMVLFTNAQVNELSHDLSSIQTDISVAKSENTRLNAQLDSLVSMNMIDQYAVEKLGMTKLNAASICYIDVNDYKEAREKSMNKQTPAETASDLQ